LAGGTTAPVKNDATKSGGGGGGGSGVATPGGGSGGASYDGGAASKNRLKRKPRVLFSQVGGSLACTGFDWV